MIVFGVFINVNVCCLIVLVVIVVCKLIWFDYEKYIWYIYMSVCDVKVYVLYVLRCCSWGKICLCVIRELSILKVVVYCFIMDINLFLIESILKKNLFMLIDNIEELKFLKLMEVFLFVVKLVGKL